MGNIPPPDTLLYELVQGDTISYVHSGTQFRFTVIGQDTDRLLPIVALEASRSSTEPTTLADRINRTNLTGILLGSGDFYYGIPEIASHKIGRIAARGDTALVLEACHDGELTQDVYPYDPSHPIQITKQLG